MRLLYFARVRERIGRPEEELDLPAEIATVADLIAWLRTRGPEYVLALDDTGALRAAVDRVHARPEASLRDAREVALFPPVTGG